MTLFWIPVLALLGTLVPLLTYRFGRRTTLATTVIAPAASLFLVLSLLPDVYAGQVFMWQHEWKELERFNSKKRHDSNIYTK